MNSRCVYEVDTERYIVDNRMCMKGKHVYVVESGVSMKGDRCKLYYMEIERLDVTRGIYFSVI